MHGKFELKLFICYFQNQKNAKTSQNIKCNESFIQTKILTYHLRWFFFHRVKSAKMIKKNVFQMRLMFLDYVEYVTSETQHFSSSKISSYYVRVRRILSKR